MLRTMRKIKVNGKIDKSLTILFMLGFTVVLPFVYIAMLLKAMLDTAYDCITDGYVWSKLGLLYKAAYEELKK